MSKKRIAKIDAEITVLEAEKVRLQENLYVSCQRFYEDGCGRRTKIKNLVIFCEEGYTDTYSCMGGGNHYVSDRLNYICEHCGGIACVKIGDPLHSIVKYRCQKMINYEELGRGDAVRKLQFQKLALS